jgi:hypothetical protein
VRTGCVTFRAVPKALRTGLGTTALLAARTGWASRRTLRGTIRLEMKPIFQPSCVTAVGLNVAAETCQLKPSRQPTVGVGLVLRVPLPVVGQAADLTMPTEDVNELLNCIPKGVRSAAGISRQSTSMPSESASSCRELMPGVLTDTHSKPRSS